MRIQHDQSKFFEYNHIADGIYIGTNQCCRMHFDEKLLKEEGITVDVSLEDVRLDQPFGVEWYLWIPVQNFTPPTPHQLQLGVTALEQSVKLGKKIYVHCQNGHGRAPTLVAAYLMKAKGMTAEAAEAFIRSRRPTIHLEEVQREALRSLAIPKF